MILSGELLPGEKIPSVRKAAANYSVSLTTVQSAYFELCADGYIIAQSKSGYFVSGNVHSHPDEEQADVLAPGQILHAQRVSHKIDHDHRVDGADDGVLDAVHKTGEQRTVCKHRLIALQGELAGQQEGLAGVHVVGIREGCHQNVVQRVGHDEHDGGADDYQNDVADLIGQTAGLLLTGCCNVFCHNGSPPLHKADVCRLLGDAVDDDREFR